MEDQHALAGSRWGRALREIADLESWREVARPFFEVSPLAEPARFMARADFRCVDRFLLSQVIFSPQRMEHDPGRLVGFNHEYLLFERYHAGSGHGLAGDQATRIDAGTLHLVDMSRPYVTMASRVAAEGVVIPHDAVGYDPSRHRPYVSLPVSSPRGRLLVLALEEMRAAEASSRPAVAIGLTAAFCDLVRPLLPEGPGRVGPELERGRAVLLRAYISRHLGETGLDAARLCREVGLSRATLYRLLKPEGGARRYITGLRLDRCFAELAQAPARRGEVRRIAERWGFHEPANFHHCFRQRFGFAPSDCLRPAGPLDAAAPSGAPAGIPAPVLAWMRGG